MTPPKPTGAEYVPQNFERFPKLALWIERFSNVLEVSVSDWSEFLAALNDACGPRPAPDAGVIERAKHLIELVECQVTRDGEIDEADKQELIVRIASLLKGADFGDAGKISAEQIQLILAENARCENGELANASYIAVKIAEGLERSLRAVAKKFDEWPTHDIWRSEAAQTVREALALPASDVQSQDVAGMREKISECLWRTEYKRATGKERVVSWHDGVNDNDKDNYRYVADAVIRALPLSSVPASSGQVDKVLIPRATSPGWGHEYTLKSAANIAKTELDRGRAVKAKNDYERGHKDGYTEAAGWIDRQIRALPTSIPAPVVDREAALELIADFSEAAFKRGHASSWHFGELLDAILALLPAGTGDAEAVREAAAKLCDEFISKSGFSNEDMDYAVKYVAGKLGAAIRALPAGE